MSDDFESDIPWNPKAGDPLRAGKVGQSKIGNLITGVLSQEISLQAQFGGSQQSVISFSVFSDGTPRPEAEITFSVAGNSVTRKVSVSNGTSLAIPSEAIKVVIRDNTPASISTNIPYQVSVQVAPGNRASNERPTLSVIDPATGGTFRVAAGASLNVAVPLNAGINSVFITAGPFVNGVDLRGNKAQANLSNPSGILKVFDVLEFGEWVPLTPGTTNIELINNIAPGGSTILFSIDFGVDG